MLPRLGFRVLRASAAWQHRFTRRFTPAGRLALGALAAAGVVGFDTHHTLGYQAFTFVAALLVIAALWTRAFRTRVTVRRVLPRYATVGEPLAYRLVVENPSDRGERGLVLIEDLADPRPSFAEFLATRAPGEEGWNRFDRALGYPRWRWLVARNQGTVPAPTPVPPIGPRQTAEVRLTLTPHRRGEFRFVGVTVARPDPFGLIRALVRRPLPHSLVVLPRRYPMPALCLPGSRRFQRGGVTLAGSVGDSEEFVALREYRAGDPVRHLHWKSWARVGRPVVKEYQDEFFVRHALVLDTFAESGSASFEEAVSVAASLACAVETHEALLDLIFVGPETYVFTVGRGLGQVDRLLEVLAGVRVCADRPFRVLHHAVVARHAALSGVLCVLLGWDEDRRALVRQLHALGVPVRPLVVTADPAPALLPGDSALAPVHLRVGRIAEGLARL